MCGKFSIEPRVMGRSHNFPVRTSFPLGSRSVALIQSGRVCGSVGNMISPPLNSSSRNPPGPLIVTLFFK